MTTEQREAAILALQPIVHRYAKMISRKFMSTGVLSYGDLVSAGWIAAIRAVDNYDPTIGVPLEGYASLVIQGAIKNEARRSDPVSDRTRRQIRHATTLARTVESNKQRSLSLSEIEDLAPGYQQALVRAQCVPISLEARLRTANDREIPLHSRIAGNADTEKTIVDHEQASEIRHAISSLDERRRTVIERHYFDRYTLGDLAASLGVSHQRVSQIHLTALKTLRRSLPIAS
jgi:RNA polymerase sigma factor (sigma-70 family)